MAKETPAWDGRRTEQSVAVSNSHQIQVLTQHRVDIGDAMDDQKDDVYLSPSATDAYSFPAPAAIRAKKDAPRTILHAIQKTPNLQAWGRNKEGNPSSLADAPYSGAHQHPNDKHRHIFQQKPDLQGLDLNDMWQFPRSISDLSRGEVAVAFVGSASAAFFVKCCRFIENSWQCDAETCIPEALRSSTPFSLALLLKLRQLSKKTRKNLPEAQARLMAIHFYRNVQIMDLENPHFVSRKFGNSPQCEDVVVENVFGLMVADVQAAIDEGPLPLVENTDVANFQTANEILRPNTKAHRARNRKDQKREKIGDATQAHDETTASLPQQSEATQRVLNRRRGNGSRDISTALQDLNLKPYPRLARAELRKQERTSRDVPTIPPEFREAFEVEYWEKRNAAKQKTAGNAPTPDKMQKRAMKTLEGEANQLGFVLRRCEISDDDKGPKMKRLLRLEAGGSSRDGKQGDQRMPSERCDLDSVPTLHTMASATSFQDLAKLGQLPLPD